MVKTTISRLIAELISSQQQRCAVMGTTGNGILPDLTPSTHTTLDALQLQNEYMLMLSRVQLLLR